MRTGGAGISSPYLLQKVNYWLSMEGSWFLTTVRLVRHWLKACGGGGKALACHTAGYILYSKTKGGKKIGC
ncbi:MAG TPA: hypothetical protein VMV84_07930 [Dehalococcoidales bacterium]|nr:hypothetical protein [Dehalococcoidales bacterium]